MSVCLFITFYSQFANRRPCETPKCSHLKCILAARSCPLGLDICKELIESKFSGEQNLKFHNFENQNRKPPILIWAVFFFFFFNGSLSVWKVADKAGAVWVDVYQAVPAIVAPFYSQPAIEQHFKLFFVQQFRRTLSIQWLFTLRLEQQFWKESRQIQEKSSIF